MSTLEQRCYHCGVLGTPQRKRRNNNMRSCWSRHRMQEAARYTENVGV